MNQVLLLCAKFCAALFVPRLLRCAVGNRSIRGRARLYIVPLLFAIVTARPSAANMIFVTTTQQGITDQFNCSLQEAIYAANFDQAIAIDSTNPDHFYDTGCVAGSGNDTIVLPAGAVFQMSTIIDDAHNPTGPTATPIVFTNITIEGNGSTIQKIGNLNMRAFAVEYTGCIDLSTGATCDAFNPPSKAAFGFGDLTIRNAYITGFTVKGGDGKAGGGGGMGAGGAIYAKGGSLTIDKCTFEANGAIGGNGDSEPILFGHAGGGGGGLGGDGGDAFEDVLSSHASAGGGGGSRGNGGDNAIFFNNQYVVTSGGGGGGGTITSGSFGLNQPGPAGFDCGGSGGGDGDDGADASCEGGGGGGSGEPFWLGYNHGGSGGSGSYGGGGGGGGFTTVTTPGASGHGGGGGFGGGGGAGPFNDDGGNGGFGGGGGGAGGGTLGHGGPFAADAAKSVIQQFNLPITLGGGGAALGGAIFSHGGNIVIQNSTFSGNFVDRGTSPSGGNNGADAGGAIFAVDGTLTVLDTTISGNESTGDGAGVVVYRDQTNLVTALTLRNTIIAGNVPGARECFFKNGVTAVGSGNLIVNNFGCPGMAVTTDPLLGPLQLNAPGLTKTFELLEGSPAIGAADAATSLPVDQRGASRKPTPDIGAYETPLPTADLSLSKTISSNTAQPGDTLTYTLTLSNAGPKPGNSVAVTDSWPSQLTFVSCGASGGGTCGFTGSSVTVSYTALTVTESEIIAVQGTLNAGVQDNLTVVNTASASASSPDDPDTSNNSASASFTVHNRADLVVTKQASAAQVLAGDPFTYTIQLHNNGPYDAKGVVLSDTQPNGVTFNSCTATVGTCNVSGGVASLSLASLLNGASVSVTIQATLNFGVTDGAIVTNTASATASTFDPDISNNSGSANIVAQNKADLFVTKKANLTSVKPLGNLVYVVVVKNLGPYRAAAVVMNDPVPANTTFVSLNAGGASCSAPAVGTVGTISCNFGNLGNGASSPTVTITVKVNGSGNKTSITNTAVAGSPSFDPNTANNSASVTTQIYGNKK
jgi:uncharacterized repeat protein (TIGR01451 family)